ncbi:hypothetical protein QFE98_04385 [Streptococcus uberis]|uniref:hypothetical protein n=1 Tax=Streptococcus uberis TaxID=1349 RepID=UPI0038923968
MEKIKIKDLLKFEEEAYIKKVEKLQLIINWIEDSEKPSNKQELVRFLSDQKVKLSFEDGEVLTLPNFLKLHIHEEAFSDYIFEAVIADLRNHYDNKSSVMSKYIQYYQD